MDEKTKGTSEAASSSEQQKQDEKPSVITPEKKPEAPKKAEEAKTEEKPRKTRRGRPVGSTNRKKKEVKVPELETRKEPEKIEDTYAAMSRLLEADEKAYEYKVKLAKRHAEIHGGMVPRVPKPAHMLAEAAGPDPSELAELKDLLKGIPMMLSLAGFETVPPEKLVDQWAGGVAKLAIRYNLQSETLDFVNVGVMTAAVGSYYVAERRAKKAGTWEQLKRDRKLAEMKMSGQVIDIPRTPEKPEA
jgi:hypothetical protein